MTAGTPGEGERELERLLREESMARELALELRARLRRSRQTVADLEHACANARPLVAPATAQGETDLPAHLASLARDVERRHEQVESELAHVAAELARQRERLEAATLKLQRLRRMIPAVPDGGDT